MSFLKRLPARYVVLCFTLLLGLGLRLWGICWGACESWQPEFGEWDWRIADQLDWRSPLATGMWNQAFVSLTALVNLVVSTAAGWLGVLTGSARWTGDIAPSMLMTARLLTVLFSAAQIPMAYLVGRRYFNSRGTGLVAAAMIAVSPVLGAQSHLLVLEVPLGFMALACLWACWNLWENAGAGASFASGLLLGLTVTTCGFGVLAAPGVVLAYCLAVARHRPARFAGLFIWPLILLAGLCLGLVLGAPGLAFDFAGGLNQAVSAWYGVFPVESGWLRSLALAIRDSFSVLFRQVGPVELLLWLAGVGLCLIKAQWRRLPMAMFPLFCFFGGIAFPLIPAQQAAAAWLPSAFLFAAWTLIVVARRIPGYAKQVILAWILALIVCVWPLWRSLGVGYLFWQQDTTTTTRQWLADNLPSGAVVYSGAGLPLESSLALSPVNPEGGLTGLRKSGGYLVFNPERSGEQFVQKARALQPMTRISVHSDKRRLYPPSAWEYVSWLNQAWEVRAGLPNRKVINPLAHSRLGGDAEREHQVISGAGHYQRNAGLMLVRNGRRSQRVIKLPSAPGRMGLMLTNQGQGLVRARVRGGLLGGTGLSLYPGQQMLLRLRVNPWPPVVDGYYPYKVLVEQGGAVYARLVWDPLVLARLELESGREQKALDVLESSPDATNGVDASIMLAVARARLGRLKQAAEVLQRLETARGRDLAFYRDLALAKKRDKAWDATFEALTGYHAGLLRDSLAREYTFETADCLKTGTEVAVWGKGYHGALRRAKNGAPKSLRVWLKDSFPGVGLRAELLVSPLKEPPVISTMETSTQEDRPLLRMEVWGNDAMGSRRLAYGAFTYQDLLQNGWRVRLAFENPSEGTDLEVRVTGPGPDTPGLKRLIIGVDLKAHMRKMLAWLLEAKGRASLASDQFEQAVKAFESLLRLNPGFVQAYLPLAKALIDQGQVEQAYIWAQSAEKLYQSNPQELARVGDLYKLLQKNQDLARVEERLSHLRPSLERLTKFSGGLTLLGYDLPSAKAKPGDEIPITFYWRCWEKPSFDYLAVVGLEGQGRQFMRDHRLGRSGASLTGLAPGQVLREVIKLKIPRDAPKGAYKITLGLWDRRFTGKSMPVLEGEGKGASQAVLSEVMVD